LTANTGIPAICLQGEAYGISETAQRILKERFEKVFICLDNDEPGRRDADKLQQDTGFINIELPQFEGGKDISDLYKVMNNPEEFKTIMLNLFDYDKK
jgi:DNA primase